MLEPHKKAPPPRGVNTAYLAQEITHTEKPLISTKALLLF